MIQQRGTEHIFLDKLQTAFKRRHKAIRAKYITGPNLGVRITMQVRAGIVIEYRKCILDQQTYCRLF